MRKEAPLITYSTISHVHGMVFHPLEKMGAYLSGFTFSSTKQQPPPPPHFNAPKLIITDLFVCLSLAPLLSKAPTFHSILIIRPDVGVCGFVVRYGEWEAAFPLQLLGFIATTRDIYINGAAPWAGTNIQ